MLNIKRILPIFLIFLLVFSSFASAASVNLPRSGKALKTSQAYKAPQKNAKVKIKQKEEHYKKTDKVRVIVEVDGDPAVTYATKKGIKYSELSKSVKLKLQKQVTETQKTVKSQIAKKAVKMQYKQDFNTTFNGFSGIVEYGQIPAIKNVVGVVKVTLAHEYERPVISPDMAYSKSIVEAQKAWDSYGYKGEGMIVGVIDTGIDPSHKDMVLTDGSKAALTKEEVETAADSNGMPGEFYTLKVPYGYNYYDENNEIRDLGPDASMHGMHVSGTVGANGNEEAGGIKGVAPEAQILGLKVFGNDPEMPSTWSDLIIKAIDDAIKLDADVVNMSLGSTGAFVLPDDPEQMAVQRAVDNGVLMSISAGNSNHIGDGYANPLAANPDKGVVGAPGLSTNSLQVASLENDFMDLDAITYSFAGTEAGKAVFLSASSADPLKQTQKSFEILDAGIGQVTDFEGKDFKGKYAFIKRGVLDFVVKTKNAQAAGAAGVIIYNHLDGFINMATDSAITIPQLFMLKSDGDILKAELDKGTKVTIEFKGDKKTAQNPTADQMSDFTSWGVTPNLDFKPEITAPGGNIYSTLNDNQYGVMSGTSMAAPHVAGGAALVLQRVKKDFANLEGAARVNMAKNLLMNTSKVTEDKGFFNSNYTHNPYSPRRQGAGVMQLHGALSTPIVVTNADTNEAKVALKEIKDHKATFTLKAENFSDEEVTYQVNGNVLTDLAIQDDESGLIVDQLESQGIYKAGTISGARPWLGEFPISFSVEELKIPANGSATVDVTVDLNDAIDWYYNLPLDQIFANGYFVEGFVSLTDVNDVNPTINVPYVGFNGDWNKAPVIDSMIYDGKVADSYYGFTSMVTEAGMDEKGFMQYNFLGVNPSDDSAKSDKIAISPNGDGMNDHAIPLLSFLRNAKSVEYKIVDEDGNVLRKIKTDSLVRKNYNNSGTGTQYYLNPENSWDGTLKNKVAADGQYYYEISATIDFPGKEAQRIVFPVQVDTIAPKVTASVSGDKLTVAGSDENGSGIAYYDVLLNGKSLFDEKNPPLAGNATEYTFAKSLPASSTVKVVAYDFAGNTAEAVAEGLDDTTTPYIHVTSPLATEVYNSKEFEVTGYVTNESKIDTLTVAGEVVELVWNAEKSRYDFSTLLEFEEDGIHSIRISGSDVAGNEINYLVRDIIVDTTAPELTIDVPSKVKSDVESVELLAEISDNFDQLRYVVDGNEEFNQTFAEPYEMRSLSKEIKTTLELEPGNNHFVLELVDIAGNTTYEEINIFRGEQKYKVKFLNGDTVVRETEVVEEAKVTAPTAPSKPGYTFFGWYTDSSFKTKFDFTQPIVEDTIIYARYVKHPAAPAAVKVSASDYNKLTVSWSKVAGASGYEVYRSTTKHGKYSKVSTLTSGNTVSYTNSSLSTGRTYYYKVMAYSTVEGKKLVSPYSGIASAKPALLSPTGVKAANAGSTAIKISWNKNSSASGYEVYRSTTKNGKYSKIATLTSGSKTSYVNSGLTTGKTYYYKVIAYKNVGGKKLVSAYSSPVNAKPALNTPTRVKADKTSTTSIKVSWSKVTGASGYEVYRSTTKNGKYTSIKKLTSGSATSFTNTKLKSGKTYYYKVRAYQIVKGKKVYSSYSNTVSRGL